MILIYMRIEKKIVQKATSYLKVLKSNSIFIIRTSTYNWKKTST